LAKAAFMVALAATAMTAGCGARALPDPRVTVAEYRDAAARGDATAVHRLLTDDARLAYGQNGTRRLLDDARVEILAQATSAALPVATVRAVAEVPYAGGERAVVDIEDGRYRVSAASGLPSAARTPAQALADLRAALSRRSYAALIHLLSTETRQALERDLRALVDGLANTDALEVKVSGATAEVTVPGGRRVVLKREEGVWRIHDLD
jgi:hypothetical protein